MLRELAADLWVTEKPLRFFGLELGSRMTVVRLGDGSLFVHSPVALDAEMKEELDRLGKVSYVVAPNRFHHLHAAAFKAAWPEARLYAAPGLETKRPDVRWDEVLSDEPPEAWAGELGQVRVRGVPLVNEVVFLHRASRTLIAADLAFQFDEQSAPLTRIAFRFSGAYKRLAPTVLERLTTRDRHETRESLERILAWDFERVIIAHGTIQETGGREALRAGYAWLLSHPGEPFAARLYFLPQTLKRPQRALVRLLRHYFERAPGWVLLTTRGRVTGLPREILLPCERGEDMLIVISTYGWRSQWLKNIQANPRVRVTAGGWAIDAEAEVLEDLDAKQDAVARHPFCPLLPVFPLNQLLQTLLRPLLVWWLFRWVSPRPVVVIRPVRLADLARD